MRFFIFFSIFILSINLVKGQTQIDYYTAAFTAVQQNDLITADSFFTLAIKVAPDKDMYFNRAQVKKALLDSCGYCHDLLSAYETFSDFSVLNEFGVNCLTSSDTAYFNKKYVEVLKTEKHRYIEVLNKNICNYYKIGRILDTKKNYSSLVLPTTDQGNANILGLTQTSSNIFAKYEIKDSTKYFTVFIGRKYPRYIGEDRRITDSSIKNLILNSIPESKFKNLDVILFRLYLSPNGKILDFLSNINQFLRDEDLDRFKRNLVLILESNFEYPRTELFGKPVHTMGSYVIRL